MDAEAAAALRALVAAQGLAALGTLHRLPAAAQQALAADEPTVEPAVSMVPLAWLPGTALALVHVSALSPHTRDMQLHPRVGLLLTAPRSVGDNPLALARLSLQADAQAIDRDTPEHAAASASYLARWPEAEITLGLGDFQFFRLQPVSARFVAGFGRAFGLSASGFEAVLLGTAGQR